jgi:hypothetical protein
MKKNSIFKVQSHGRAMLTACCCLLLPFAGCNDNNGNTPDTPSKEANVRYRGINSYNGVGEDVLDSDIDKLGAWKVNLVRWWLIDWNMTENDENPVIPTPEAFRQLITSQCEALDASLPALKRNGIKVCLVMGSLPGGRLKDGSRAHRMFYEASRQDEFVAAWEYIATHYKDEETVVMYDLMNEPNSGAMSNQRDVFLRTAQAIRAIDAGTEIVYEPVVDTHYEDFEPFDLPGIVYSDHVYEPLALTHQGAITSLPVNKTYPGVINGVYYDDFELRRFYRPIKRFADKYNVRILIGEFGCARWAPNNSAYNYFKDCIAYFEEEGWDWTYHSLIPETGDEGNEGCYYNWGSSAWCLERDTVLRSPCLPGYETNRIQLLKSYWAKNQY